jgi:hypothetical protein
MYINERIKDIEDIQNGITVENLVLYDKLRIFSCDGPDNVYKHIFYPFVYIHYLVHHN